MTELFNLEVFINVYGQELCPMVGLDAITKRLIRVVLFNATAAIFVVVVWAVCFLYSRATTIRDKPQTNHGCSSGSEEQKQSLSQLFLMKLEICFLRIITFGYKNLASVTVTFVTCVEINGTYFLFIDAGVQCFTYHQYGVFAFLASWVFPVPIVLYVAFSWYRDCLITFREFLCCLAVPPLVLVYWGVAAQRKASGTRAQHNRRQFCRIREMYEEPYRLRSHSNRKKKNNNNKHLTVTKTISQTALHPAKNMVGATEEIDEYVFWEHWRLLQRLLLSILVSYLKNPINKIYMSSPLILIFLVVYLKVSLSSTFTKLDNLL